MSQQLWYYVRENKQQGPIPEGEMHEIFESGVLGEDTLVWCKDLTDWTPASKVAAFESTLNPSPPPLPIRGTTRIPPIVPREKGFKDDVYQIRPWVRYWARQCDYGIASLSLGLILTILTIRPPTSDYPFLVLLFLFGWIFAEASLLSTCGTTPGKWLLRIKVRDGDGRKLTFLQALKRSFTVWWAGIGFGIPIAAFATFVIADRHLEKNGKTIWDRDGGFAVSHERIGPLRAIATVVLLGGLTSLLILGYVNEYSKHRLSQSQIGVPPVSQVPKGPEIPSQVKAMMQEHPGDSDKILAGWKAGFTPEAIRGGLQIVDSLRKAGISDAEMKKRYDISSEGSLPARKGLQAPRNIYRNSKGHFSFTVPNRWVEIPRDVVNKTIEVMRKQSSQPLTADYEAAFQKSAKNYFTCPYIVIAIDQSGRVPGATLGQNLTTAEGERALEKELQKVRNKLSRLIQDVEMGKTIYDKDRKTIFMTYELNLPRGGKKRVVSYSILSNYGGVWIHFYSTVEGLESSLPYLTQIIDSFRFDPGYEY